MDDVQVLYCVDMTAPATHEPRLGRLATQGKAEDAKPLRAKFCCALYFPTLGVKVMPMFVKASTAVDHVFRMICNRRSHADVLRFSSSVRSLSSESPFRSDPTPNRDCMVDDVSEVVLTSRDIASTGWLERSSARFSTI
jgi:hypothetical protein